MTSVSRRNFVKLASIAGLAMPFVSMNFSFDKNKPMKPKALQEGDTVGLISPAGAIYESLPFQLATEALEAMGLKVKPSRFLKARYGHLAGTDKERASEINEFFADDTVKAIIAIRGGSGCARILDLLDYNLIKKTPKIIAGYSDITALLLAIYSQTDLVTFHAPVASSTWNSFSYGHFKKILFEKESPLLQNPERKGDNLVQTEDRIQTIRSGKAKGILVGGNLSVLTGIVGSRYLPNWKNKILFLEEVNEEPYRVDRMFSQLKLAGILQEVSGVVFGKCTNCKPSGGYGSLTVDEILHDYLYPLDIPAFQGTMIGHIANQFTIPIGIEAEIDTDKGTIQLLHSAVE
ncbi:S66 peptidase family protein [Thermoflexibacter ruber]|uniref:Muramoyltetrapeptide carboxypeptidase n=1 Tax=Thermoflexibacter ruber TaxID=1003 RepID=A0A1I2G1I3_9BACT|nr:LD-carboxypeptidase [Thermoflexibacter ruber]SFF11412.1 muramoyltetrapeptide carboxypeptidase [Thermoflexibacter ruber]